MLVWVKKKRVHKTLYLCVFSYFFLSFQGIFISRVRKGGPSEKAGIHVGDRLLEVCSSHIIYFYSTIVWKKQPNIVGQKRSSFLQLLFLLWPMEGITRPAWGYWADKSLTNRKPNHNLFLNHQSEINRFGVSNERTQTSCSSVCSLRLIHMHLLVFSLYTKIFRNLLVACVFQPLFLKQKVKWPILSVSLA